MDSAPASLLARNTRIAGLRDTGSCGLCGYRFRAGNRITDGPPHIGATHLSCLAREEDSVTREAERTLAGSTLAANFRSASGSDSGPCGICGHAIPIGARIADGAYGLGRSHIGCLGMLRSR